MTIHTIDLGFRGVNEAIGSFLVESNGQLALFETGPHSTFSNLKQKVEVLGYSLDSIKDVFITHIHLDHAGAAWALAELGATVYLHPVGYPHMNDPSRLMSSAKRIYQDEMETLWGDMKAIPSEKLRVVEHGEIIQLGELNIKAHHTPGHAVHHIAWQLGDILFAGDVAGVKIGKGIVVPPCPPPDINIEDWIDSINLIRQLDLSKIYLTHFGPIDNIEEHLNNLEKILWDWANWMKPYYDAQTNKEEIIPKFQNYVAQQLMDGGIDDAGLEQYEKANPSWMSVAGLLRYWKKKLN
jgi:glyoxylase-like metal-dependent hydrolase (beta-lactamase superfamily II)